MMQLNNQIMQMTGQNGGYKLFLSKDNALICRRIINGKLSETEEILFERAVYAFDSIIDKNNVLHIVLGDHEGNIMYIKNENGRWLRIYITLSNTNSGVLYNDFSLLKSGNNLTLLYTVIKNDKTILYHQCLNVKNFNPYPVCELSEHNRNFFNVYDNNGNIIVFYCENGSKQFGAKKYNINKNNWEDFRGLIPKNERVYDFFVLNNNNKIYISYKADGEIRFRQYESLYKISEKEKILSKRHTHECSCPILFYENDTIHLKWSKKNVIFSSSVNINSENWQRMKEEDIPNVDYIKICKLCNADDETEMVDMFYDINEYIYFCNHKNFFNKSQEQNNSINEYNYFKKTKLDIEREKEEIIKKLGIKKSNDSFDINSEYDISKKNTYTFSSTDDIDNYKNKSNKQPEFSLNIDIINELNKINKNLSELLLNIKKINTQMLKTNKKTKYSDDKRIILSKVHKK